jgi:hypothetical protein
MTTSLVSCLVSVDVEGDDDADGVVATGVVGTALSFDANRGTTSMV